MMATRFIVLHVYTVATGIASYSYTELSCGYNVCDVCVYIM